MFFALNYDEPLFRPPSEARSLILQVTLGCSWNKCAFCEMYTSKKFRVRKEEEVFAEIDSVSDAYRNDIKKVFLADGNPMVLSFQKLERILDKLNNAFPKINRISTYALPSDLLNKSLSELKILRSKGLKLLYVGIESGDNELLEKTNKSENYDSMISGLGKARSAGIKLSVMILNGLGGKEFSSQHAINSARVVNEIQPEYLSTLVLSYPYKLNHFQNRFKGDFNPLDKMGLIREMRQFIGALHLDNTVFRSDHASNYLILRGNLNRDKEELLARMDEVIEKDNTDGLRPEWMRGL